MVKGGLRNAETLGLKICFPMQVMLQLTLKEKNM